MGHFSRITPVVSGMPGTEYSHVTAREKFLLQATKSHHSHRRTKAPKHRRQSPPPPGPLARGRPTAVAQLAGVSCGAGEGDGSSAPPAAPEKQTVLYSTTRAGAAQMMGWGGRASTLRVRSVRAGACSSVRRRVRVWRHECAHTQARVACGRVDEPLQIITLMLLFFCKRTPPRPPHPVDRLTHLDAQRQLKTLRSRFLLYLAGPSAGRG